MQSQGTINEESFVYIFNAKDFNKSIDKISFSLNFKILSLVHLGHSMFSGDNYYVIEDTNEEDDREFFIAKLRFRQPRI